MFGFFNLQNTVRGLRGGTVPEAGRGTEVDRDWPHRGRLVCMTAHYTITTENRVLKMRCLRELTTCLVQKNTKVY